MQHLRPLTTTSLRNILQTNVTIQVPIKKRYISISSKFFKEKETDEDPHHPLRRTLNILGKDFKSIGEWFRTSNPNCEDVQVQGENITEKAKPPTGEFQSHCDVLVIGGGGVGSSISYWLKEKARNGLNVVVVDKDPTHRKSMAIQSFHGLHQNFSVPENIQMSLYGTEFMRDIKEHLGNDVNLNFTPYGSLRLACEEDAETLKRVSKIQNELGVRNELLSSEKIKSKFPWMNTEGIVLGCHGLEREGWFDPLALLFGYKNKATEYGAHFVDAEVIGFEFQSQSNILLDGEEAESYQALDKAIVQLPNGEKKTIKFALCVIAGGSNSGHIASLARIGKASGLLSIPLPVEQRKRNKYIFSSSKQQTPAFSTPLTVDPSGCYFTREGLSGNYLCGQNNWTYNEQTIGSSASRKEIFDEEIRPNLAKRVDAFKDVRVKKSWTETCEYSNFDDNGIIGTHPYYNNLYIAAGFNRHGMQQTAAIGRGISELIIDGRYRSIDLERLGFDRFVVDQPLYEISTI